MKLTKPCKLRSFAAYPQCSADIREVSEAGRSDGLLLTEVSEARIMTRVYELDGSRIETLEAFFDEVERVVIPGYSWGRNLDAFNDVLRGGFGTPEEGFTLRWVGHQHSKERLGYPETVRQLTLRLRSCHPSSRNGVERDLEQAGRSAGPTVFDWLVDIIREHGPGGCSAEDGVKLDMT